MLGMIGLKLPAYSKGRQDWNLQVFNQFLLLLEDVLELAKGGLHLLQRELVLALLGLVLGHPGVELGDGVVQEGPFLHQDLALLDPGVGDSLDLGVSLLEGGDLSVSLSVGGHLLGGGISSIKDLEIVKAGLVEGENLFIQSLDLIKVGGLGQTLGGGLENL